MPLFGPTGYAFTLDSYDAGTNAVGAAQDLPDITEYSGIKEEAVVSSGTRLGDDFDSEVPTGVKRYEDITIKGLLDDSADGAFRRIGRPAGRADYPKRTFTEVHKTGLSRSIEVFVKKNDPITGVDEVTMFEAVLGISARESSDVDETGF